MPRTEHNAEGWGTIETPDLIIFLKCSDAKQHLLANFLWQHSNLCIRKWLKTPSNLDRSKNPKIYFTVITYSFTAATFCCLFALCLKKTNNVTINETCRYDWSDLICAQEKPDINWTCESLWNKTETSDEICVIDAETHALSHGYLLATRTLLQKVPLLSVKYLDRGDSSPQMCGAAWARGHIPALNDEKPKMNFRIWLHKHNHLNNLGFSSLANDLSYRYRLLLTRWRSRCRHTAGTPLSPTWVRLLIFKQFLSRQIREDCGYPPTALERRWCILYEPVVTSGGEMRRKKGQII